MIDYETPEQMARDLVKRHSSAIEVRKQVLARFGSSPSIRSIGALRRFVVQKHRANLSRDRAIGQAYFFGKTRKELADEYGLTERRISQIIAEHRATMRTPIGRRDAFRAMRWNKPGRPRDPALAAMNEDDRKLYGKIMRSFGAAYAREAMGIAA